MKLKRPHFEKLKSLTKKQKKLILAGIALFLLILAACYTVFIAPLLQKEQWIYKEETVERGTLKVGVTESGSLEYNTKSIDYNLDLDVSDDDEDDSEEDDDDTVQKYLKIEKIYAASGQRVTEGEELLKFTEDSVEAVRALLQNAVVEAQAEDALSENESAITDLQNQLAAAQAKQKIDKLDTEETYQEAVITGQNAQTTYNATVEDLKETLQEAEETKEKREEQLQAFEDFVGSDGIIYATEDGVITEVSYEAGDRLTTTGALSSYATSDDMRISVDVTQEDIVDLKVGDAVDITFTAYPEDSYTGSILSINTTATSDYSNTVSYTVEISVEGELEQLYGGMTADVIFVTEEKEDVLYVSRKAIVEENGKTYVYRKTALGGRELAEVETGITNGVDIEILSGLEEGDTIYLASKVSSEEEVKSTEETADSGSSSDTAVGSDTEFGMSEDMQMPGGGDMPQGGPGGGNSGNFGGGMPGGPGGQ
ncbi:MAG: efflux RND transporter periplasmic adaptor subunit [Waltera sp.]